MAIAAIAAIFAVFALVKTLKYLLSTELEERHTGWFHRTVLRAVPVQALKIVVVVWQILTQVGALVFCPTAQNVCMVSSLQSSELLFDRWCV